MNKIHYTIVVSASREIIWDGETPHPPAVGDYITVEGVELRVMSRSWETAGDTLGCAAAHMHGHCVSDHVHVTLRCEETNCVV